MIDMFDGLSERPPINGKHAGPAAAICAECGVEIGAYESRRYGDDGAIHTWKPGPGADAELAACLTHANKHKYPHYYTDD